jgi:hypothetical protein
MAFIIIWAVAGEETPVAEQKMAVGVLQVAIIVIDMHFVLAKGRFLIRRRPRNLPVRMQNHVKLVIVQNPQIRNVEQIV